MGRLDSTTTSQDQLRGDSEHVDETFDLISAEKVEGTPVYNRTGDRLGTIHDLMIDKRGGRVAYAVMSFGGFLGIGDRYHPLPWSVLTYDQDKGGYNVDLSEDKLRNAPTFSYDQSGELERGAWARSVNTYYGVPPYTGL